MGPKVISTLSFDDGHPNDLRVAALLKKYSLKATFYIPVQNAENEVMSRLQMRKLHAKGFEIGSHGLTHRRLPRLSQMECMAELRESKKWLEYVVGSKVLGYCFAGGKYHDSHVEMAADAGYAYCRSTRLLRQQVPVNGRLLHTTMQYHQLSTLGYLRHILRRPSAPSWRSFFSATRDLGVNPGPLTLANYFTDKAVEDNSFFHLHGHSYEFASPLDWKNLEALFEILGSKKEIRWMDNHGAYVFLCDKENNETN